MAADWQPSVKLTPTLRNFAQDLAQNRQDIADARSDSARRANFYDSLRSIVLALLKGRTRRLAMPPDAAIAPNWHRADDYSWLQVMDRPSFAWELLRRNPSYRSAVASFSSSGPAEEEPMMVSRSMEAVAAHWGLFFR